MRDFMASVCDMFMFRSFLNILRAIWCKQLRMNPVVYQEILQDVDLVTQSELS